MPTTDPATMLTALAHPVRLRLLARIADAGEGGCGVEALRADACPRSSCAAISAGCCRRGSSSATGR